MSSSSQVVRGLRVAPGEPARLAHRRPADTPEGWLPAGELKRAGRKKAADKRLETSIKKLGAAQELLYANDSWSVLVIMQGLDAAGKDGTVKHVMSGLNPQGCQVASFKQPSAEELDHDFLWRVAKALPERGRIGIFNRSHYEDVLVSRVHPNLLESQQLPGGAHDGKSLWKKRYDDINAFERHLDRNGTRVIKFFLHVSQEEQRSRLLDRLDDPAKQWKFSDSDLSEHRLWADYQKAYEEAITATSTKWAPWYVIPADHKHVMRALVGEVLASTLDSLHLTSPTVEPGKLAAIGKAKAALLAE